MGRRTEDERLQVAAARANDPQKPLMLAMRRAYLLMVVAIEDAYGLEPSPYAIDAAERARLRANGTDKQHLKEERAAPRPVGPSAR